MNIPKNLLPFFEKYTGEFNKGIERYYKVGHVSDEISKKLISILTNKSSGDVYFTDNALPVIVESNGTKTTIPISLMSTHNTATKPTRTGDNYLSNKMRKHKVSQFFFSRPFGLWLFYYNIKENKFEIYSNPAPSIMTSIVDSVPGTSKQRLISTLQNAVGAMCSDTYGADPICDCVNAGVMGRGTPTTKEYINKQKEKNYAVNRMFPGSEIMGNALQGRDYVELKRLSRCHSDSCNVDNPHPLVSVLYPVCPPEKITLCNLLVTAGNNVNIGASTISQDCGDKQPKTPTREKDPTYVKFEIDKVTGTSTPIIHTNVFSYRKITSTLGSDSANYNTDDVIKIIGSDNKKWSMKISNKNQFYFAEMGDFNSIVPTYVPYDEIFYIGGDKKNYSAKIVNINIFNITPYDSVRKLYDYSKSVRSQYISHINWNNELWNSKFTSKIVFPGMDPPNTPDTGGPSDTGMDPPNTPDTGGPSDTGMSKNKKIKIAILSSVLGIGLVLIIIGSIVAFAI
jgi:hypothetical protein